MTYYESALRRIKKLKKKDPITLDAETMYLAIARYCDRTGKNRIEEDFELMGRLLTEEYLIQIKETSEKLYDFLSIPSPYSDLSLEESQFGLLSYIERNDTTLEKLLINMRKELKMVKSSPKKAKEMRDKFISNGFMLLQ